MGKLKRPRRSVRLHAHEVRAILEGRQTQLRRVISCHCNRMHYDKPLGAWGLSTPPFQLTQEEFDDGVWNWRWQGNDPKPGDWIECIQTDVDDNMYLPVWNPFDCESIWYQSSPTLRIELFVKDVRVERLNDIDEAGAIAEGFTSTAVVYKRQDVTDDYHGTYAVESHWQFWERVQGSNIRNINPWTWVARIERIAK
jgi:hypothetical protein